MPIVYYTLLSNKPRQNKSIMNTKKTCLFFLVVTALIILSYYYVDRQLVCLLYAHHSRDSLILTRIAGDIVNVIMAFIFLFYIYFAIRVSRLGLTNTCSQLERNLLLMSNAVVISIFLKSGFKLLFSRYAAETFLNNHPSLTNNAFYGFKFFAFDEALASFPSGHTAAVVAFSASMWFLFPRLRWVWAVISLLVVIALVAMYYHFVSDVIAGAALGYLVAVYNIRYGNLKENKGH